MVLSTVMTIFRLAKLTTNERQMSNYLWLHVHVIAVCFSFILNEYQNTIESLP